jgi:methylisocitrate lyase
VKEAAIVTWLAPDAPSQAALSEALLARIRGARSEGRILVLPGAYDGLSALMARRAGFEALYLSGAAYTASRGWPDIGLLAASEVAERARDLVRATRLPVLVDIDTGYGGVLQVARAAREMVEASVAAVQIEDQALPKKCGHLNGKQVVSATEMAEKICAIKEVAPSLAVVARTDARAIEGLGAAIARAEGYVQAGADAIFVEALETADEFAAVGRAISAPLLANMTEFGRTPLFAADQFAAWGFSIVIFPVSALRMAARAYEQLFDELQRTGTQAALIDRMQSRAELYETIDYYAYEALDSHIAHTVVPETTGGGESAGP